MKMYYIMATMWDKTQVMCHEATIEHYGYDGSNIEMEMQFQTKEYIEQYDHHIAIFNTSEIETIMQFRSSTGWNDPHDKKIVFGKNGSEWRDVFKNATNIEVKEIVINF